MRFYSKWPMNIWPNISKMLCWYSAKMLHNAIFYLLIFAALSDSESEASYASVPRKNSTDSANSNTANNRYRWETCKIFWQKLTCQVSVSKMFLHRQVTGVQPPNSRAPSAEKHIASYWTQYFFINMTCGTNRKLNSKLTKYFWGSKFTLNQHCWQ